MRQLLEAADIESTGACTERHNCTLFCTWELPTTPDPLCSFVVLANTRSGHAPPRHTYRHMYVPPPSSLPCSLACVNCFCFREGQWHTSLSKCCGLGLHGSCMSE